MGRFRPRMTSSKLLRNNIIHHKTMAIPDHCLKHFSNEATAFLAQQKVSIIRIRITESCFYETCSN